MAECDVCGTLLTKHNTTSSRVHELGNCAQVLLAQRDEARDDCKRMREALERIEARGCCQVESDGEGCPLMSAARHGLGKDDTP